MDMGMGTRGSGHGRGPGNGSGARAGAASAPMPVQLLQLLLGLGLVLLPGPALCSVADVPSTTRAYQLPETVLFVGSAAFPAKSPGLQVPRESGDARVFRLQALERQGRTPQQQQARRHRQRLMPTTEGPPQQQEQQQMQEQQEEEQEQEQEQGQQQGQPQQTGDWQQGSLPTVSESAAAAASAAKATAAASATSPSPPPPLRNKVVKLVPRAGTVAAGFDGLDAWSMRYSGTGAYQERNAFFTPPDASGCIGNGFIVQPVNLALAVYNVSGALLAGPASAYQFLGLGPPTDDSGTQVDIVTDGSCVYDRDSNRFYYSIAWQNQGPSSPWDRLGQGAKGSGIALAVSSVGDPRLPWSLFFIPASNSGINSHNDSASPLKYMQGPFFGDFPQLGVDRNGVYVTTNQVGTSERDGQEVEIFAGRNIYCLGKSWLLKKASFTATRFALPAVYVRDLGSIIPLYGRSTADPTFKYNSLQSGTMVFASMAPFANLAVWAVTRTAELALGGSSRLNLHLKYVATPKYLAGPESVRQRNGTIPWGSQKGYSTPPEVDANAKPGSVVVALSGSMVSAGEGWAAWPVALGRTAPLATALAQFSVRFRVVRAGRKRLVRMQSSLSSYRTVTVPGQATLAPAINFPGVGRGVLVFSLCGSKYFPSAAYTYINRTSGAVGPAFYMAAAGKYPLDSWEGYSTGVARFGDWQTVVIDGKGNPWAFAEYVSGQHQTPTFDSTWSNWATRIFQVQK